MHRLITSTLAIVTLATVGCIRPDGANKTLPGKELFAACASCHGDNGTGQANIAAPNIAGLPAWYVEAQLVKYRSGIRGAHPDDLEGLRMRPMFNWAPHRIHAHIAITVLALLLERVIEHACQDTWRNIRDDLRRIQLAQLSSPNGTVWQITEPTT